MLPDHFRAFTEVAISKRCSIYVRTPNPASDPYIDDPSNIAKPLVCKAKTANNPHHRLCGLVVSPLLTETRNAFLDPEGARGKWLEFTREGLPEGYTVDADPPDRGCVRYRGHRIHADYDLLSVSLADQSVDAGRNPHLRARPHPDPRLGTMSPLVAEIRAALNSLLGKEMVRHGAEFDVDFFNYGLCDCFDANGSHRLLTYTGTATPGAKQYHC